MTAKHNRLQAWLELCRLSNAPTVVTNVMVGTAAVSAESVSWITIAFVTPAILLFYIAGMALNDIVDTAIDTKKRPQRPIPSGRITRRGALIFSIGCFAFGIAFIALASFAALIPAAVLFMCIVLYDLIHKQTAWSVFLMGACRGLVYLVAAAGTVPTAIEIQSVWTYVQPYASSMTAYIVIVTLIARRETESRIGIRSAAPLLLPLVILAPIWGHSEPVIWIAAGTVAVWSLVIGKHLIENPPRPKWAILRWLACICAIDSAFLLSLGLPFESFIAIALFGLTTVLHRTIPGT